MATAKDNLLHLLGEALREESFVKLTVGGYRGRDHSVKQLFVRPVDLREGRRLSFVWRYATRDVTKNFPHDEALALLDDIIGTDFRTAHLFTTRLTAQLEFREGRQPRLIEGKPAHATAAPTSHDRVKQHRIDPRESSWLEKLGVTAANGTVMKGMEAKFRQINKFIEVLEHLLSDVGFPEDKPLKVVDMGCGKGYLTFAAAEFLQRTRQTPSMVNGVESRAELVSLCNGVAVECGFKNLRFENGTIESASLEQCDVVLALHACDTATDDAIARGVQAGASLIIVSPCCHKELRQQLRPPPVLAGVLRHGILLERCAEFVTDGLRAALLECAGYDTRVFEFIASEHTAKNLMIAALKSKRPTVLEGCARRARELAKFYGVREQQLARRLSFSLTEPADPPA
jgi:SAM-dependent methyltransferase